MREAKALKYFSEGFNCSQAILSAYCEEFGLSLEMAERLSVTFGGGLGRQGKLCGCVSGALMVLGLEHGGDSTKDTNIRISAYDIAKNFSQDFKEKNGALDCKDIIKYNLSKPEDRVIVQEKNIFQTHCTKVISNTVKLLDEYISK